MHAGGGTNVPLLRGENRWAISSENPPDIHLIQPVLIGPCFVLCALCFLFRRTAVTHRAHKAIQSVDCCPRRVSRLRFPWLSPIRNPFELRGLCRRSYFGPRTCGRSINHCHRRWQGSQSGFPILTLKCPLLCSAPSTKVLDTVHSWWR